MVDMRRVQPTFFRITQKGRYTWQVRALARHFTAAGMAERNVGGAIQEIALLFGVKIDLFGVKIDLFGVKIDLFGVKIDQKMDWRTVQRCVLEGGITADIQVAYEMAKASSAYNLLLELP
jgi:hypothetical protein